MATPSPQPFPLRPPPVPESVRASERIPPKGHTFVSIVGSGDTQVRGLVLNLSEGGFAAYLYGPLIEVSDQVLARLTFHGRADVFKVFARVKWVWRSPDDPADAAHYGFYWLEGGDLEYVRILLPSLG